MAASTITSGRSRPLIMGILNVTPDSFSDGGRYASLSAAVEQGVRMARDGADIIDVGGESTRPGALRVPAAEQMARVLDVIEALHQALPPGVPISVDTTLSEVAEPALARGASIINDVSAGDDDPRLLRLAAEVGVPVVLMHMRGTPETMQVSPQYQDVVAEVEQYLRERAERALATGIAPGSIILDPGIGFGKTREQNLRLINALPRLVGIGYPLLLGVSRKRFMGSVCQVSDPAELVPATCVCTAVGVMAGVAIFRVHDVAENRQAADLAWALRQLREKD